MSLRIVPVTFEQARLFIRRHHRHHGPPLSYRLALGVADPAGCLRGVAAAGRPVAKELDDGFTLEVTRTCTDGTRNANSMLYGAITRAAKAVGYTRLVTYTEAGESGASLRAAGWRVTAEVPARASGQHVPGTRWPPRPSDGTARVRWEAGEPRPARNGRVTATRLCGNCARRYIPARSDARYCSGACRQAAYRRRQEAVA